MGSGASIQISSYAPYAGQLWCNGHERAKRQLMTASIAFAPLKNGFASCAAPDRLQRICDGNLSKVSRFAWVRSPSRTIGLLTALPR